MTLGGEKTAHSVKKFHSTQTRKTIRVLGRLFSVRNPPQTQGGEPAVLPGTGSGADGNGTAMENKVFASPRVTDFPWNWQIVYASYLKAILKETHVSVHFRAVCLQSAHPLQLEFHSNSQAKGGKNLPTARHLHEFTSRVLTQAACERQERKGKLCKREGKKCRERKK